jgi:hypothetical protein
MTRWKKIAIVIASVCVAAGIAFALLPRTWIELWFGADPDGGSGLLEFLVAALPIMAGLALAIRFFKPFLSRTSRAHEKITARDRNPVPHHGRDEIFNRLLPANDTYNAGSLGLEIES